MSYGIIETNLIFGKKKFNREKIDTLFYETSKVE